MSNESITITQSINSVTVAAVGSVGLNAGGLIQGNLEVDGNVVIDGLLTVGADTAGKDVRFWGETASKYTLWDASQDKLIITGDLQVDGTTTTINSTVVTIEDPVFTLGGATAPTTSDSKDRGIEFHYYDTDASAGKKGFFGWGNSDNAIKFLLNCADPSGSEIFTGDLAEVHTGKLVAGGGVSDTYAELGPYWDFTGDRMSSSGALKINAGSGEEIHLQENGTDRLIVRRTTGNVGIGTMQTAGEPQKKLEVDGEVFADRYYVASSATGSACFFGGVSHHGLIQVGASGYGMAFYAAGGDFNINTQSGGGLGFSAGNGGSYTDPDIRLRRDAAGIMAMRTDAAAQEFRIYSDLGNPDGDYERSSFAMDTSGNLTIGTAAGGTGTAGNIILSSGGNVSTSSDFAVGGHLNVDSGNIDMKGNDLKGLSSLKIEMDGAAGFKLTNPNNGHGVDIYADDLTFYSGGSGTRKILTDAGDLEIAPVGDLLLSPAGGDIIIPEAGTMRIPTSGRSSLVFNAWATDFRWDIHSVAQFVNGVTFNNNGQDFDFKVGSQVNGASFFVEGSSGNCGIGTDSPTFALEIDGGTGDANDSALKVISGHGATGKAVHIQTNNGNNEALTIQGNGNCGLGTAAPTEKLEVDGNIKLSGNLNVGGYIHPDDENGNLAIYGGNDTTNDAQIVLHGNNNGWGSLEFNYGYDATNSYLKVSQGATEHLRITGGGKVGVGVAAPAGTMHLNSALTRTLLFTNPTQGSTNSDGTYMGTGGTTVDFRVVNQEAGKITLGTSNTHRFEIDLDGNVGIGPVDSFDPAKLLHLKDSANNAQIVIDAEDGSGYEAGIILQSAGASRWQIFDNGTASGLNFYNYATTSYPLKLPTTGIVEMDRGTSDIPFIDYKATADADTTSAISTLTTSGATTHHIQVDINGTKAWIAVSTNNPS